MISEAKKLPSTVAASANDVTLDEAAGNVLVIKVHIRGDGGGAGPGRERQDFPGKAARRCQDR